MITSEDIMTVKEIKKELKEMEVEYDTFSFLSERVPNLFFTFIKGKEFSTRYFMLDDFGFSEISKSKFYLIGQESIRAALKV